MINVAVLIYTIAISLSLFCFSCGMNNLVLKNVTTNENIRKRWNASRDQGGAIQVTAAEKFKYFYWDKLPKSRIQRYHELKKEAVVTAEDSKRAHSMSMMSQGSQGHSIAGGGSVLGGGGFQFDEDEIGPDIKKLVRRMEKDLLKEIDNHAVLLSYGIDVCEDKRKPPTN